MRPKSINSGAPGEWLISSL